MHHLQSYLAFPRLGRAQSAQAGSDDCCPIGLKNEWLDETEKSEVHNICQSDVCCIGLKEIIKRKPDGVYYSMCIPTASCSNEVGDFDIVKISVADPDIPFRGGGME